MDECFKKLFKFFSEEEIDNQLNRVIELFRLIKNKDIFKHYYKKMLANRLIFSKSLSEDMEK